MMDNVCELLNKNFFLMALLKPSSGDSIVTSPIGIGEMHTWENHR